MRLKKTGCPHRGHLLGWTWWLENRFVGKCSVHSKPGSLVFTKRGESGSGRLLGYLTSNSTKGIDEMSASLGTGGFVNKLNEEAELLDDLVRPVHMHFYILDGNRTSSMLFIYEHISFSY